MRDRAKLSVMTRLATVQRAKRVGAEAALAEARRVEQEAQAAEENACATLAGAHRQWVDHMAEFRFLPEYSALLSNVLVRSADDADAAARETAAGVEARAHRQSEWQVLEARVRAGDDALRGLRRKVARRIEETRIADRADRTTFAWTRA